MSILKANNKVIRGIDGSVLYKSDAIIDLRSTFGVTKDGSNNVSKVALYNNKCQVFRANIGKEPIENGNGFEMQATDGLIFYNHDISYDNVMFTAWVKMDSIIPDQRLLSLWSSSPVNFEFQIKIKDTDFILFYSKNGVTLLSITFDINTSSWDGIWRNVGFWVYKQLDGKYSICALVDGRITLPKYDVEITNIFSDRPPISVGARTFDSQTNGLVGNIDDILILNPNYAFETGYPNTGMSAFVPRKRSSE